MEALNFLFKSIEENPGKFIGCAAFLMFVLMAIIGGVVLLKVLMVGV